MKRSNKHQIQKVTFASLVGGINTALPGEQIGEADMQVADNYWYTKDSQRLSGRGGLSSHLFSFGSPIVKMYYDVGLNYTYVFLENNTMRLLNFADGTSRSLGTLTGERDDRGYVLPTCAYFNGKLWVASGGKLQYSQGGSGSLYTVQDSPPCDVCFQRNARIMVTRIGEDNIYYSSVGDGATWAEDTNDASSAQWVEVGYGDEGDICAVVPMATDLFVLKTQGTWYQFQGDNDTNSWLITPIATGVDAIGRMNAVNIGSSVVYLSRRGLRSLEAVMDYGNVATKDIGDKFQSLITTSLVDTARMVNLRRHKTLLIRPTSDHTYWVAFNYALNAATVFRFGVSVTDIVETPDRILVASGGKVYEMSEEYFTDAGEPISYVLKPRDIISSDDILVKNIDTKFTSAWDGTATVSIGDRLHVDMPVDGRRKVHCNHSDETISLKVESSVPLEVDHIMLDIVDL